jgi:Family of unknown function (DUF6206)
VIDPARLEQLEQDVIAALDRADASSLRVLGYGEISMVLGWPAEAPRLACKRLPPFPSANAADRYCTVLARYLHELTQRGVNVVETEVARVPRSSGEVVLYCVQPVLPEDMLGPEIVARGGDAARNLLGVIVETVLTVVDSRVGLDAQLSNWGVHEGRLSYFDVTTPLLAAPDGSSELDTEVFLQSLPWALRAPVRRLVLPGILGRYHSPRTVVLDLAANLVKERCDRWIPTVLDAAGGQIVPPLTEDEVRRDYRSDARTWNLLQAMRRVDRSWQRRVRRRTYPFLLPERIER